MNKKILISLSVIGAVAAIAIGGTIAYFSDTETSVGNTFTAGTIDISLDPSDGQVVKTVSGDLDLKPSQVGWTTAVVTNDGTNLAEIWKHIDNVVNDENLIVEPEQEYYDAHSGSANWKLSNWIHYDMLVYKLDGYSYSGSGAYNNESSSDLDVTVEDTGNGWLKWTYTYAASPTHTPKMSVAINYPNGYVITTFDDGSHDGWYYAPDGGAEVKLGEYVGYDGSTAGYKWVKTTASGNVLTVSIKKTALDDTFKWHGYANYNGQQVWIGIGPDNGGVWEPRLDASILDLEIEESEGFYLSGTQGSGGVESKWIYLGVLEPQESMTVKQSYHLDSTVDNWGQSDMVTFDVDFMAQQTTPLPEPPANVLFEHGRP